MAERHIRAVQRRHEQYTQTEFLIMQVIAADIGRDNSPAYPSYREIAERTGVHYNTVGKYVKQLAGDDRLVAWKEGRRQYYNLPFDCGPAEQEAPDEDKPEYNEFVTHEELSQALSQIGRRLSQTEARLSQALSQIELLLSQLSSQTVTSNQRGGVTEELEDKEYIHKPSVTNPTEIVTTDGDFVPVTGGTLHEVEPPGDRDAILEMRSAIASVVKETMTAENQGRFTQIAGDFVRQGIEPEHAIAFKEWWGQNGHYSGRPSLTSLVNEIRNSMEGVAAIAEPSKNGQGAGAFEQLQDAIRRNDYRSLPDSVKRVLGAMNKGTDDLKNMPERQVPFFRREFIEVYNASQ